jgi:hypothetical protein
VLTGLKERVMLGTTKKIVDNLNEAERLLLAAMNTKDKARRHELERKAELCLHRAEALEKELEV